jgi:hypothetical protein
MYSKELIKRVEELANVYLKVITSLDSKERKIEMFDSYYKMLRLCRIYRVQKFLKKVFMIENYSM